MIVQFNRFLVLAFILMPHIGFGQGYTNWITGDTADVQPDTLLPGIVLAGGGGDNDMAMQWMLSRAGGGDVVVIRASGSDGYNPYFYSELNVTVNSVETFRFESSAASTDPYVINRIRGAECLFIAGGDQYDYYTFWKDTPIEEAINYLIREKGITVGGTSAGMAVLAQCYYTPSGSSLDAEEALGNPYHPDYDILGCNDFLDVPYTQYLVTDTHYEQRERPGRHVGMLARIAQEYDTRSFGIAANEYTAVAIDEAGIARAFGEYPEYEEDYVFFLQANCQEEFLPEAMEAGTPLTWDRGHSAVKVYAVPARTTGEGAFDLNDWQTGSGGEWQNWYVQDGELMRAFDTGPDCAAVLNTTAEPLPASQLVIFPNPATERLFLKWAGDGRMEGLELRNAYGQVLRSETGPVRELSLEGLAGGVYFLEVKIAGRILVKKFVKG
ncbi:MAG: Type 1 glutamine amidotransferase-like domain-containing protein [Lewinellaceae bacterium]|nr:Type 1 glutamine amidotransferase-like domain-containing protein [Lewinellaceae bacterium]